MSGSQPASVESVYFVAMMAAASVKWTVRCPQHGAAASSWAPINPTRTMRACRAREMRTAVPELVYWITGARRTVADVTGVAIELGVWAPHLGTVALARGAQVQFALD